MQKYSLLPVKLLSFHSAKYMGLNDVFLQRAASNEVPEDTI